MSRALYDFDQDTGVATVTLNRPEVLNALDPATAWALHDAVTPLAGDAAVRCLVLKGAGRAFMAGGDIARFAEDPDNAASIVDEMLQAMHPVIETLRSIDAPVLASVQGVVAGAGLSLAMACDLIVAARGTRFLVGYDRVGTSPDCSGTYFLPRLLGVRRAAELMLLSEEWDAETAERMGLINRVVEPDHLLDETDRLAARLAAGPTRAYGSYKRLADASFERSLSEHLVAEGKCFKALTRTGDFRRGTAAFVAKSDNRPEFRGE